MSKMSRELHIVLALTLATIAGSTFASDAFAWDHCGVGRHRTAWGDCVSNYAIGFGMRGCPVGYHLGRTIRGCFPN